MRFGFSGLMGLLASLAPNGAPLLSAGRPQYRQGTPSKRKGLGVHKRLFRTQNPGVSLDMLRYQRRYGGTAALKARFPFTTKKR